MQRHWIALVTSILLGALDVHVAPAAQVIIGVNVEDIGHMNEEQQDALLNDLHRAGVRTIRTGILNEGMRAPKFARFLNGAFKYGITTVLIIYPTQGGTGRHTAPANPSWGRKWPVPALSDADPEGFAKWLGPQIAAMEAADLRLAAFELGNEFNTAGYNGDFPVPGSGRVLGLSDLNNSSDSEASSIAAGYKAYLMVLAVLKEMRDHSRVNRATPILLGGLANMDLPKAHSFNKIVAASIPDTIRFLRQNGIDKLVDAYAVHTYPNGDPQQPVSQRAAVLQDNIFAECRPNTKPCWLTEWNFNNTNKSCPINDATRARLVQMERQAFRPFVEQGRLAAALWYTWNGDFVGEKENPGAIFRCGALTDAGKLAMSPM